MLDLNFTVMFRYYHWLNNPDQFVIQCTNIYVFDMFEAGECGKGKPYTEYVLIEAHALIDAHHPAAKKKKNNITSNSH